MMRLKVTSVADRGNHDKERIVMRVTSDTDVGGYAIFRSVGNEEGGPTTKVADVFGFPDGKVKTGDVVVLYTKRGATSNRPHKSGEGTVRFYYWGKPDALWTPGKHAPVPVFTSDWQSFTD